MSNFIEVFDNTLSTEECKYIINYMNTSGLMKPGLVTGPEGGCIDKEHKDSNEVAIDIRDKHPVNDIICVSLHHQIEKYKELHPQLAEIEKWGVRERYNLQKYKPNQAYFGLHCENAGPNFGINKMLVWMFYLNTITDDGGTYFDNYDLTMNAVEGRCVIWPAYWTHMHRGIVSKTESKYIVTGWFSFIDNV